MAKKAPPVRLSERRAPAVPDIRVEGAPQAPVQSEPERKRVNRVKFMELARERFAQAENADKTQRERELLDLRMYAGDQWDKDIQASRAGLNTQNGLPPVPARPCLTFNKVRAPVNQILNAERQADMGIEIVPADDFTGLTGPVDHTEIELREGLVRRIQRAPESKDARTWAFARAVQAGRGYYGVNLRWSGRGFDQDIYLERFYNQSSVSLDPAHEQPDGSDADWAFIGRDMPYDQYTAEFPKARAAQAESDEEFRALGDEAPGWFSDDQSQTRMCRVVSYYYVERTTKTIALMPDGTVMDADQVPEGVEPLQTRQDIVRKVYICKIDGVQILEEPVELPGPYIPIIKVLGNELQPYDKERRVEGMVRPSIDAQRGFNYVASEFVFRSALVPVPPLMVAEGQTEGYEPWYEAANTRALPYLPYRQTDLTNKPAPPPFRAPSEMNIERHAFGLQMFDQLVKSTTEIPDPTLGNVDPTLKSGKAIKAVIEQSQRGTSNYLDNLRRSMEHEARIINSWLATVYMNRPGRLVSMMTGQNEAQPVMMQTPMLLQGQGRESRAVPAPDGHPDAKVYRLTKDADWNIAIKISKAYDTRREEEAAMTGEIIASDPAQMGIIGDLFFKNQDGPGAREMSKRYEAVLDPRVLAVVKGQTPPSPEVQQKLQQLEQMVTVLSKELQEKSRVIETDSIKAQQQLAITQAKAESDAQIKLAELQSKQALEMRKLEVELEIEMAKLGSAQSMKRAELEQQQLHEHSEQELRREELGAEQAQADMDRQADRDAQVTEQAFEAEENERSRAFDADQAERGRAQEMTLAEKQAQQQAASKKA